MYIKRFKVLEGIGMVKAAKKIINIFKFTISLLININNSYLIILFFVNIIKAILPFLSIKLMGELINGLSINSNVKYSIGIFICICIIKVLNVLFDTLYTYYLLKFQMILNLKIENRIIDKSIKLKYHCFENSSVYDELKRASSDSISQPYSLLVCILDFTKNIAQIISVIFILITSNIPYIFLLYIIPLILIIPNLKIISREHDIVKFQSQIYRQKFYFRNLLTNNYSVKEVKFYNLGSIFSNKFNNLGEKINKELFKLYKKRTEVNIGVNITIFSIVTFLQYQCLKNTFMGLNSIGDLTIYFQTILKVDSIISDTMATTFSLYKVTLFIEHLYNYLNIEFEENLLLGKKIENVRLDKNNSITFNNVYFSYPNDKRTVLKDINLDINQGEIISIIGENGSGKSTLLNVLSRLYEYDSGKICYNGVEINQINLLDWRNELKILTQDYVKYELTVKENIIIRDKDVDYNKLNTIIEILKIGDFINRLPNKIETQLGVQFHQGVQLSQGEWQKVSIARCLYKDGLILLLDEPSAALDTEMEKTIFKAIRYLINCEQISFAFFITHNYENLKYSDKTIVMKNGECVEFDNYRNIKSIKLDELERININEV